METFPRILVTGEGWSQSEVQLYFPLSKHKVRVSVNVKLAKLFVAKMVLIQSYKLYQTEDMSNTFLRSSNIRSFTY